MICIIPRWSETSRPGFSAELRPLHGVVCHWFASLGGVGRLMLRLFVGFLPFNTLFQDFVRISPEFHRNFTRSSPEFTRISLYFLRNFAGISNWSTLKQGITTTRPSHTRRIPFWSGWNAPAWCSGGRRPLIAGCGPLQRVGMVFPVARLGGIKPQTSCI